jgi:hypothetical protein
MARQQRIKHRIDGQPHLHEPVDRGAAPADTQAAVIALDERHHVEVDRRRQPAVQAQLFLAVEAPPRSTAKILVVVADRLLRFRLKARCA